MQVFIIVCLLFILMCAVGMNTNESFNQNAMKSITVVSLCTLIWFVWSY